MKPFVALIPIKDHSERVPGKNFREIAGKPLWQHIVATLSSMEEVASIFIDTDSQRFTRDVLLPFPKVSIIERPQRLCGDFVPTNHLFAHDLTLIPPAHTNFLQTHTTNPLLTQATIRSAMKALTTGSSHDSLFTVTPYFARFFHRDGLPINHDPKELKRTQDLEPVLEENSNLYLFTRDSFAGTGSRIGSNPMMFEMDRLEATDIDDPATWELAELLLNRRASSQ
ncbi:acylneuraminate cytidylyltransferase family protein [Candidatus Sumerlaeota bacterium]|nr:acylneuraminate cytidylyltransferase family protein [Candidatus Sumerlaeota bacterium]